MTRALIATLALLGSACGQLGIDVVDASFDVPGDASVPTDAGPLAFDHSFQATNTDSVTLEGRCTGAVPITLTGADAATTPCAMGRFAATLSRTSDGVTTVEATQGSAIATADWRRDTEAPVVTDTDVPSTTVSRIVSMTFSATDNHEVASFCFDWRGADPSPADPCFVPVDVPDAGVAPGPSITLESLPFSIGFVAGGYTLRVFVRDRAGNVSLPTAANIAYEPSAPPVISRLIATVDAVASEPPTLAQVQVAASERIFVRWNATAEAPPLSVPEIFTTTDERAMIPATIIADCTGTPTRNACAVINAPADTYFRVRVLVRDAVGQVSTAMSPPLNSALRLMAGTTETSAGSGAVTANIQPLNPSSSSVTVGAGAMVVVDDGTIFLRESSGDIIEISPTTALIERVLRDTGESTGDGGPVRDATSDQVHRLAIDGRGALLVWDRDRIRRIDLSSADRPIETIIGGGDQTGTDVPPLMYGIAPPSGSTVGRQILSASTNGDVFFAADGYVFDAGLQHFDASEGVVRSLRIQGAWRDGLRFEDCGQSSHMILYDSAGEATEGVAVVRTQEDSACPAVGLDEWADYVRFDPATGDALGIVEDLANDSSFYSRVGSHVMDGLDGTQLFISEGDMLGRYDPVTQTMALVAGTRRLGGPCADETLASECPMRAFDATTSRDGSLYILDNGQIRTIDVDGQVLTIYGRGVGPLTPQGDALDYRFSDVNHLQTEGDTVTLVDTGASVLLEFGAGVPARLLAGTGVTGQADIAEPADMQPIWTSSSGAFWGGFHRVGDDIYYSLYRRLARLRANLWQPLIGDGATPYFDVTPATPAADVAFTSTPSTYPPRVIADNGAELLISAYSYDRPSQRIVHARLVLYNIAAETVSPFAGTTTTGSGFCSDGTALDECTVTTSNYLQAGAWSDALGGWLMGAAGEGRLVLLEPGQPVRTIASFPSGIRSFAYDESSSELIVACTTSGDLLAMHRTTLEVSTLELGAETVTCTGPLHIDAGTLTFAFEQNGLQGIAQVAL